ncbi:MAG: hypothetical protein Q9O62_03005 [Ardenticatenia bacterium]|nr:hypothetical protein [Ardenticatenia bacterium]
MDPLRHAVLHWFARRRLFYGWAVVLVCFVVISLLFSVRLSFGIFFEAFVRSDTFPWGRGETAGVFSVTMLMAAVGGVPVGWLLDRFGARRVFLAGQLVLVIGLVLTSRKRALAVLPLLRGTGRRRHHSAGIACPRHHHQPLVRP